VTSVLALVGALLLPCARAAEGPLQYNLDIRPILFDACVSCHGPDSASRQADLRLDQHDAAVDAGAIVPGDPNASEMIRRILSEDDSERMPPPETKKTLTAAQEETLVRWVAAGAQYEPHWSLIKPERSNAPPVQQASWVRNPIDQFVLARLEAKGLPPAPEADRRALARRVWLDLTGLPPSPEQLAEYLADDAPDAYERLVDRLLASPRWGEHRGRYWLDAARYADTHGLHFDNYREMWVYRDWVIRAFNANMPFDEFTVESLAGDLLPNATLEQRIGSGFNRCNITTNEGGAIDEEYLVLYNRDRTEAVSQVWLGLTTGCAVCHDHKFDPFSQREFYELAAFFNNTTQAAMDGNTKETQPIVLVPGPVDAALRRHVDAQIPTVDEGIAAHKTAARPQFDAWLAAANANDAATWAPGAGLHLKLPLTDGGGEVAYTLDGVEQRAPTSAAIEWRAGKSGKNAAFVKQEGVLALPGAGDFEGDQPFSAAAWIKMPANDSSGAIVARIDDQHNYRGWDFWLDGRRIGGHIIHKWSENAIRVISREQIPADQWVHVALVYDGSRKAGGLKVYFNGVNQPLSITADTLTDTVRTNVPLKIAQRDSTSPLTGAQLEDVRIYNRALDDSEVSSLANATVFVSLVSAALGDRPPEDVDSLFNWWLTNRDDEARRLAEQRQVLERQRFDIDARSAVAHVMHERDEAAAAYILNRGEYDQRLDRVTANTPDLLPPMAADLPRNRLGLARWLLDESNPLTARVSVNRFWQELFGQGLVRTTGDFGASGELPSHPELLDWLAIEFRESGWDVKKFYKLMVTSSAYRQSAAATPEKLAADPDNRLLSRGPRFRMDAEMVRDYALAASGTLAPRIGGPSVRPYQPPGVWEAVAIDGSNTQFYKQDHGGDLYRRSLYTFWKRSAPPASMEIFNAPSRERCTTERERTNTPIQALVTLNDPQFIEAARQLAQRAIHEAGPQFEGRIALIAERLLARSLTAEEQAIVCTTLEQLAAHYSVNSSGAKELIDVGESTADPAIAATELAAWTMVVNQLMNLDEVLNK
jgi:cytochrome c553